MRDLTIRLKNQPGALAEMGEALGKARVSIEGGGGFVADGRATAHFLFADADAGAARAALEAAGIEVMGDREVLSVRLDQQLPGQLGSAARAMADANVNIEVIYSDHQNQLILGVDDVRRGQSAVERWQSVQPKPPPLREHHYRTLVRWLGDSGTGTSGYRDYRRDHSIEAPGKPPIPGSSDPHFLGDRARWNPEELLVASLSACHQLWYLHLCSEVGVIVTAYADEAMGLMTESADGSGRFARVVLRPSVRIRAGSDAALALALHARAHDMCFIARSVAFPVVCEPAVVHE